MDKLTTPKADMLRLIRFAAILWLCYLSVLAVINHVLQTATQEGPRGFSGPPGPSGLLGLESNVVYFIILGFVAVICLVLAYWPWIQERLGRVFIPAIIGFITIIPISITWIIIRFYPPSPMLSAQGSIIMVLPFFLVAFILVAWQYNKWTYMIGVILGVSVLYPGIIWVISRPGPEPFRIALYANVMQAAIFPVLGFSISYLIKRLNEQQKSLEAANIRLTHHASTLEHLSTSRERNRVARELHDTLAHTLSGLSVQLETIKAYWDIDRKTARSILNKSLAATHSGLDETRRALKALRASPLDDLGLVLAIRNVIEESATRANLSLDLAIPDNMPALSPDVEQCVYRIAQEAVINVTNHANAKNLEVKLESIDGKISLIVRDDGVGFDAEKNNHTNHFGLTGMRERAQLIGGELDITSKPGFGTTIHLTI